MGTIHHNSGFHLFSMLAALAVGVAGGLLLDSEESVRPTELSMAQSLSGQKDVRLIGFQCGDHNLTAVAQYEDEFPESGCKEIRILNDKRGYYDVE
jgi:hypothetical protein